MTTDTIIELAITILLSGSLFALAAVGFTLAYRVTKIMHLAHGVVVLGSGYAFWWALARGSSFTFAVLFTLASALAMGWCMHTLVYERLRRRGSVATTMSLVATLALLMLGQNILLAQFGSLTRSITAVVARPLFLLGDAVIVTTVQSAVIVVSLASIFCVSLLLRRSRFGKRLRAVADNAVVAQVIGINVRRVRLSALLLSSLLAGIVGILYALEFNLAPSHGTEIAIRSFSRALIGGIGSVPGAVIGSFLIETVEDLGAFFYSAGFKSVFSFAVVFVFLLFRPRGLFGEKVRREDL